MKEYTRKCLADELGIGIETLRYYESAGIISPPRRDANGYRIYTEENRREIAHYLQARSYGFTPKEVRALLERSKREEISKREIITIIRGKTESLDRRIAELTSLRERLEELASTLGGEAPPEKA
jgi:MerR family transcriptional regulator, copper efflux regulator